VELFLISLENLLRLDVILALLIGAVGGVIMEQFLG